MTWIDGAIDEYINFLKAHIKYNDADNGWYSITTPFLNVFNDCIDIYCKNEDGNVTLSDGGETFCDLELFGVNFNRPTKRKDILEQILLNYGVKQSNKELIITANLCDFAQAKHNLLSAIMEISDMYMVSKSNAFTIFRDDVNAYLDEQEIVYTPGFISKGVTGLEYNFDFHIASRKSEILINTFNIMNKSNLAVFLFNWGDIKDAREKISKKEVRGLAIINDSEKEANPRLLEALQAKGADYIKWTSRHQPGSIEKLKAA